MARITPPRSPSAIELTAAKLRDLARTAAPGAPIGVEEALVAQLNVSRNTIRQAARLLEREGLLRVKRGISGGYFAARPDLHTVTDTVSAYLDMTNLDSEGATAIASTLWVAVIQMAANMAAEKADALTRRFRGPLSKLAPDVSFDEIYRIEAEIRDAIFGLIDNGRYIQLIFQINIVLGQRRPDHRSSELDNTPEHREFALAWRNAKLMEIDAIAAGDQVLAIMAARHSRDLWHRRLWVHNKADAPVPGIPEFGAGLLPR